MPNRPEYLAIWLGVTRVGGVVALLNTNLTGQSLAHCVRGVSAKHLVVAAELADALDTALPHLAAPPQVWVHGGWRGIDEKIESLSAAPLEAGELREITIDDRALYIFTSGSTGFPKAANVSHARVMQWGLWFAGMMDAKQSDRLYNCLPMYHSVGGVLAPGAMLAAGGSLVVGERFSASQFWSDITRWECTAFQYIGELCRYLLHRAPAESETAHSLRLACGNGLAASVWEAFQERFRIPQVLEFYAATEGGISLFNVQGKPGAVGHIPPYLAHRFAPLWSPSTSTKVSLPATRTVSVFAAASTSPARRSARCRTIRRAPAAGSRATPARPKPRRESCAMSSKRVTLGYGPAT